MSAMYVSVIIPSYNEVKNLKRQVLKQVHEYLKTQKYSYEVILSDDGSKDGTLDELKAFAANHPNFKVLANPHRGKAATVTAGMLAAKGEWRLFTDFDQSTPILELAKLLAKGKDGYQVVVGSREGEGAKREGEPMHRHLMGRVFNAAVRLFAVGGIHDTQNGFKLFSATATEQLFSALYIYGPHATWQDAFTGAFDVELLFLARKFGFTIAEVPIVWTHRETDRVSPLKDSLRMFRDVVRIRLAAVEHKYPAPERS